MCTSVVTYIHTYRIMYTWKLSPYMGIQVGWYSVYTGWSVYMKHIISLHDSLLRVTLYYISFISNFLPLRSFFFSLLCFSCLLFFPFYFFFSFYYYFFLVSLLFRSIFPRIFLFFPPISIFSPFPSSTFSSPVFVFFLLYFFLLFPFSWFHYFPLVPTFFPSYLLLFISIISLFFLLLLFFLISLFFSVFLASLFISLHQSSPFSHRSPIFLDFVFNVTIINQVLCSLSSLLPSFDFFIFPILQFQF